MSLTAFLQYCLTGISIGGIYALIAIGYTMVYGILRLINFAHGDIFMMAAYFMIFAMTDFLLPWQISVVIVIVATIILGVVIEWVAYRPLRSAYVDYDFGHRCFLFASESRHLSFLGSA